MPYDLRPFGNGKYKVCKKNSTKCFSKKPLPKARAKRQMAAMHINTNESTLNEFNIIDREEHEEHIEMPAKWWNSIRMERSPEGRIAFEFYTESDVKGEPTLVLYYDHKDGFYDDIKVEGEHYEEADQNPKFDLDEIQFAVSAAEEEMNKTSKRDEDIEESLSFEQLFKTIIG
jgi:hypothetical protein